MGLLSGGVQWWEEWQLRVLVLSSLCVQFFLFFAVWVRRVPGLRRLRVVVWMAYIGGDALAIYALASLFNRHQQRTSTMGESMSSSGLEVIWAPVLLIHLGGHVTLSAFSMEDNELWLRHVITLVSQVAVALYIFCKWWSGELRLLLAAVMLFFFGILKFSLKPWALRKASYSQMLASTDVSRPRQGGGDGDNALSLDEYVRQAKMICDEQAVGPTVRVEAIAIRHTDYFVDLSAQYGGRLSDLRYIKQTNASYEMLQKCFEDTFDLLYTRVGFTRTESILLPLLPFLALASVVLFAISHKQGYNKKDIKVTYILFSCTTLLEFLLPLCGIILSSIPCLAFLVEYLDGWHDMVSQYNLMSFYVRKKKPTLLMKLAFFQHPKEYVSKVWYIRQVPAACQITELVQRHIQDGWKTCIQDAATYRRFSDLRGQLTLKKHQRQPGLGQQVLWDSFNMPFDKSVLLWHIATNLCFHHHAAEASFVHSGLSMKMSDYMLYLLFIRAEMLLPGTRPGLFTVAINNLEFILKNEETIARDVIHPMTTMNNEAMLENEETIARDVIRYMTRMNNQAMTEVNLISEAYRLVVSLMDLHEEERWQIIQGVWVEMLCYSASRCRGFLHAKSLGEGGEYLSYVWLLWSYMGMETLADKIQKPQSLGEEEILVAGQLASPSQGPSQV